MKKTINIFGIFSFLFVAIIAFNSNILGQAKQEILIVADTTANCTNTGATGGNCLQIKRINEEKFTVISENIENFQFIPGYFYLLEVSVSPAANPPANGSKSIYQLEKILGRVKTGNSSVSTQANFSGTEWKLTRIEGNAVKTESAFIKFEELKEKVTGNGGCNDFNGSLIKNGNQIKMPEIFATRGFCAETSSIETKFLSYLMDRVTRYEITDGKLKLFAGNLPVLEFEAKK